MSYRKDIDLEFLQYCSNEELKNLFEVLTSDPKDNLERITSTLKMSNEYKILSQVLGKNSRRTSIIWWKYNS
ncbi:DUF3944 domain-containing protein [Fusobacterium varium]|uniref:DUF3944 domain-containing protein n=1 Tax=Fusobacterium varium TaxID=856 RepID=UPI000E49065C|nr:DUF3944 domain-containing protein [Fusobacterium varium]RHG37878.1 DUF3944 domain-containing protein [Fusobacterium varium]